MKKIMSSSRTFIVLLVVIVAIAIYFVGCAAPPESVADVETANISNTAALNESVDTLYYAGKTPVAFKIIDGQTVCYGVINGSITCK